MRQVHERVPIKVGLWWVPLSDLEIDVSSAEPGQRHFRPAGEGRYLREIRSRTFSTRPRLSGPHQSSTLMGTLRRGDGIGQCPILTMTVGLSSANRAIRTG